MRIVLAYSGSLEGSAAIVWLRQRGDEVVTATLDLGQGPELEAIRDRALALGARRAHVLDTRDQFAQQFVLPALRADACHADGVPMVTALTRPLIAQTLVDVAAIEKADAVAHTGTSLDGVSRLDRLLASRAPGLVVQRPAREWTLRRADLLAFARAQGLGFPGDAAATIETNVWGRVLALAPGVPVPSVLTPRPPEACPDEAAVVDLAFTRGVPTALNGVALPLHELVASLTTLADAHGIASVVRGDRLCAAPAALLLHAGHRALAHAAAPPELGRFVQQASAAYVQLVEQGQWFSPLRDALDAFFDSVQSHVHGHVRLRLHKGTFTTTTTELTPTAPAVPARIVPSLLPH